MANDNPGTWTKETRKSVVLFLCGWEWGQGWMDRRMWDAMMV